MAKYDLHCMVGGNNGTEIYVDEKLIEMLSLHPSQNQKITSVLEEEQVPFNISTNNGVFAPRNWSERVEKAISSELVPDEYFKNQYFTMFTTPPEEYGHSLFEDIKEVMNDETFTVQKFLILGLIPEQKKRLQEKLESMEEVFVTGSSPFNLEVTHINGHKGTGLKVAARHFGIPLEHTVAIGDERNDIPMLQAAGLSIAMGNAEEEVKKHSDIVTLTNDEDGVAYAFENYILNKYHVKE
ncbi:MAG: HAD hydrolase family protein [Bacillota bacterium]